MKRLVVIGGGRDGLETLAYAVQQNDWTVAMVVDSDPRALVFRLEELGYRLTRPIPTATRLEAVSELGALDLAVETTTDRGVRKTLTQLIPNVDVVGANTIRFLWALNGLSPAARPAHALERFKAVADQIDVAADPGELAYLITASVRVIADADMVRLYRWDEGHDRLVPWGPTGGASGISAAAHSVARERRPVSATIADQAMLWLLEDDGAKAVAAVPVQSEDDFLGVIEVRRTLRGEAFSADLQTWLSELAHRVVRPLKKLRTLRQIREAAQEESLRREIRTGLTEDRPLRDKLQNVVATFVTTFQALGAHLYVRDPQHGDLLLQASTMVPVRDAGALRLGWGQGLIGEVAAANRLLVLRESLGATDAFTPGPARGFVAVPLSAGRAAVGVLVLETPPTVDVTPRMIAFATEVGEILGGAVAGEAERHKMSQKVIKLSVVNEEGLQLLSITDREKVLMVGVASTAMILDAEAVVFRVRERRGSRLLVGGTHGLRRDDLDAVLIQLDQAVATQVAESMAPLRSDALATFGVALPKQLPYRTVLAVPVLAGDQLVGTVSAYNKVLYNSFACGAFDADDQEILEKFSFYLGRALIQAQEFRDRQALITIDEVTGLRNRRYLDLRLPEEVRRAERYERKVSLLIMEVVGFDALVQALSPQKRDDALRSLAGMMSETFRNVDIVARLQDARFGVVMPDTGERIPDVLARLERAIHSFRLEGADGSPLPVRLAVGTCTYPTEAATVPELFERAERLTTLEPKRE